MMQDELPGMLRATLDDLQRNALRRLVEAQTEGSELKRLALEQLTTIEAMARRDWAVRVLDAQLGTMPFGCSWDVSNMGDEHWTTFRDDQGDTIDGAWDTACERETRSPDAARLAAAQALVPSLPADVRAELGECP